jgi:hypothetical protein
MPRLELIFLHSASADGCNDLRAKMDNTLAFSELGFISETLSPLLHAAR